MRERDRDALKYLNRVSGKTKVHIITLLLVQMSLGMSSVFYALFFRDVIDGAVSHDREAMIHSILCLVLLVMLQIAFRALVRFLQEYANAGFENAFKERLFTVLLTKDYGAVTAVHSGEWVNRLTSDTTVIAEGLSTILPGIGEMLTKMCGAAVMILIIEPRFGLLLLPGGLLLVVLTYIFRKQLKKLHRKVQEADGKVRVFFQEHLESLVIIKSYARENISVEESIDKMREHKQARIKKNHFSNLCNVGFASAMNGAYLLGVVYSAFGIYNGTVSYGTLMALLQLIGQIQTPFANITGYLPKYYAMIASAERLMEVERFADDSGSAVSDTIQQEKGLSEIERFADNRERDSADMIRQEDNREKIDFAELGLRRAAFFYENEEKGRTEVFENLDFTIRRGEFVAFTGSSGCGKSTVLKLLMSLYPLKSGEKYIVLSEKLSVQKEEKERTVNNGKNDGQTVRKMEPDASFRKLFAYVPQGNLLMSGSIRDIVTFGESEVLTDRMKNALDISCASDFVSGLPQGVETVLGERGTGLSEGQMQRIALARAIYSDRPVLLLDEATSALDEQTEKRLLANLRAMTDKTLIIVTHRQAALSVCDREVHFGPASNKLERQV